MTDKYEGIDRRRNEEKGLLVCAKCYGIAKNEDNPEWHYSDRGDKVYSELLRKKDGERREGLIVWSSCPYHPNSVERMIKEIHEERKRQNEKA